MNVGGGCSSGTMKVDGSCSSAGSGGGTTPVSSVPLDNCKETVCVNFDQFDKGETNLVFQGISISGNQPVGTNPLMIFDSAAPAAGHEDLGAPNVSCPNPGPGVGAGGTFASPNENCEELRKILIFSANPPAPADPIPKADGGVITVNLAESVSEITITMLNVITTGGEIKAYDCFNTLLDTQSIAVTGANGIGNTTIAQAGIRKLTIKIVTKSAVAKITYKLCPNGARAAVQNVCEDFDGFVEGETNIQIVKGTVTTNDPIPHPAMVFNSSAPTAGDTDLGTPNIACVTPGPGVGAGGAPGQVGENCLDLSHILVISQDAISATPDAKSDGGQFIFNFTEPVVMKEIHLLNHATDGDLIEISASGIPAVKIVIPNLGDNSFQVIKTNYPYPITQMVITVSGQTGIAKVCYCASTAPSSTLTPTGDEVCLERVIQDWEEYPVGDTNIRHYDYELSSTETLMIFDSGNPAAGQEALGTPHTDFAGPGVGTGGQTGSAWENNTAYDKVLIASSDGN